VMEMPCGGLRCCRDARDPLRLRSGQAFDCAAASLREAAAPLRMTNLLALSGTTKEAAENVVREEQRPQGLQAPADSDALRGAEAPLFHGDAHFQFFPNL